MSELGPTNGADRAQTGTHFTRQHIALQQTLSREGLVRQNVVKSLGCLVASVESSSGHIVTHGSFLLQLYLSFFAIRVAFEFA